jgi:hypothetical protein
MPLRLKGCHRNSNLGVETFHLYVTNAGGDDEILPIAFSDVAKVEVVELGVAVEGSFVGTNLAAALYKIGDAGYNDTSNLVASSDASADVEATDNWGVTRFDPPTEILPDYSGAGNKLATVGDLHSVGDIKLALRRTGTMTTFTGWVWARLRIYRIEDL